MFADKHEIINSHLWFILFSTHPSYLLIRWMKMEMELSSTLALEDRSLVGLRRSAFAFATPFRILPVSPPSIAILFCPRWWWQVIFLILISRDNLHTHPPSFILGDGNLFRHNHFEFFASTFLFIYSSGCPACNSSPSSSSHEALLDDDDVRIALRTYHSQRRRRRSSDMGAVFAYL